MVLTSSCWIWEIVLAGRGEEVHSELSFRSNFAKSQHRQKLGSSFASQQGFVLPMLPTFWNQSCLQRWAFNVLRSRLLIPLLKYRIWNIHSTSLAANSVLGISFHIAAEHGKLSDSLSGKIPLISLIRAFRGERSRCNDKNVLTRRKSAMLELN